MTGWVLSWFDGSAMKKLSATDAAILIGKLERRYSFYSWRLQHHGPESNYPSALEKIFLSDWLQYWAIAVCTQNLSRKELLALSPNNSMP